LKGIVRDEFLMLKAKPLISGAREKWTVICHSWRVRVETGVLTLPEPQEQYLNDEWE
jgi:hypothetical protein